MRTTRVEDVIKLGGDYPVDRKSVSLATSLSTVNEN